MRPKTPEQVQPQNEDDQYKFSFLEQEKDEAQVSLYN